MIAVFLRRDWDKDMQRTDVKIGEETEAYEEGRASPDLTAGGLLFQNRGLDGG